jgi:hypothetical protein
MTDSLACIIFLSTTRVTGTSEPHSMAPSIHPRHTRHQQATYLEKGDPHPISRPLSSCNHDHAPFLIERPDQHDGADEAIGSTLPYPDRDAFSTVNHLH